MDRQRILFAIIFFIVTILLGFAIYWVFFAKKDTPTPTTPGQTTQGTGSQFPTAGEGGGTTATPTQSGTLPRPATVGTGGTTGTSAPQRVGQILTDALKSPAPDPSGGAKFYNQSDGRFYRLNTDGTAVALSDEVFFNVEKATWSPNKNEGILEYPDGSNIYYNFDTERQVTLPKHWEEFSFSPIGDKIAAKSMGLSPENRWVVTSNPDGTESTLIEPMGDNANKVTIDWSPNKQIIALSRTGEALGADRQEVLFVGLHGENFRSTVVEGRDFQSAWSPQGNRLIYSVYSARSDFKPELWIVNASGDQIGSGRKFLNLNTWSNKCAFANERTLYCGVPQQLDTGTGFAPALADNTPDQIIRVDLETGTRTEIETDDTYVVDSMFVGDDGKTLYFTDKRRTGLFSAPL